MMYNLLKKPLFKFTPDAYEEPSLNTSSAYCGYCNHYYPRLADYTTQKWDFAGVKIHLKEKHEEVLLLLALMGESKVYIWDIAFNKAIYAKASWVLQTMGEPDQGDSFDIVQR